MALDPNWFYSSLAQCSAAIVGLFGAVLATRMQQQLVDVRAKHEHIKKLIEELGQKANDLYDKVEAFQAFADARIAEIFHSLDVGESEMTVLQEVEFWGGGRGSSSGWPVPINEEVLASYTAVRDEAIRMTQALGRCLSLTTLQQVRRASGTFKECLKSLPPEVAAEPLLQLREMVEDIEIHYQGLLRTGSMRIPAAFVGVLGWLCMLGLIVPLALLSASHPSLKWTVFAGFSIGVLAIPAFVAYQVVSISRLKRV